MPEIEAERSEENNSVVRLICVDEVPMAAIKLVIIAPERSERPNIWCSL